MITAEHVLGLFDELLGEAGENGNRADAHRVLNDAREDLGLDRVKMVPLYWFVADNDLDYYQDDHVQAKFFFTVAERRAFVEGLRSMLETCAEAHAGSLYLYVGYGVKVPVNNPYWVECKEVAWEKRYG